MDHLRSLACLAAALTCAAEAFAQVVIPVSGGGAALATAAASAPDGAVLVVANATYTAVSVPNKNLTIYAPARATIEAGITATGGTPLRTLRLVNLDVGPGAGGPPYGYTAGTIVVADHLHMVNCTCQGLQVGPPSTMPTRKVLLEGCTITPSYAQNGCFAQMVATDVRFETGPVSSMFGVQGQVGLFLSGSLRAERCSFLSATGTTAPKEALEVWGTATLANCTLVSGGPGVLSLVGPCTATLSSTALPGGSQFPPTVRLLATAQWNQRNWSIGGTSTATFREAANTAVAVFVSWNPQPWTSPAAAELLWLGSTPDHGVWSVGVTDAQGIYGNAFPVPNVPALQYSEAWLTGVFFHPIPLRTTAPIGGLIL